MAKRNRRSRSAARSSREKPARSQRRSNLWMLFPLGVLVGGIALDSYGSRLSALLSDNAGGPALYGGTSNGTTETPGSISIGSTGTTPDSPPSARPGDPLALQGAGLTDADLPIDENGRTAQGRQVPGLLPRQPMSPEVQSAYDALVTRRATIAANTAAPQGPVFLPASPDGSNAPPRIDGGFQNSDQIVLAPPTGR